MNVVKVKDTAQIPTKATADSAGFDLHACLPEGPVLLGSRELKLIDTGVSFEIPKGHFGLLCPRSGLAAKFGVTILNGPGVIDADYRGEIKCILINMSDTDFEITDGMRIAQIIIMKYEYQTILEEREGGHSSITKRGINGFGSSGV